MQRKKRSPFAPRQDERTLFLSCEDIEKLFRRRLAQPLFGMQQRAVFHMLGDQVGIEFLVKTGEDTDFIGRIFQQREQKLYDLVVIAEQRRTIC